MEIRLLTTNDAAAWWHLRLEALQNDLAAFCRFGGGAPEHNFVETARERPGAGAPDHNFVLGMFANGRLAAGRDEAPKLDDFRGKTN